MSRRAETTAVLLAACLFNAGAGDSVASEPVTPRAELLVVRGASGTDQFAQLFDEWESLWRAAAQKGDVSVSTVGTNPGRAAIDELRQAVADAASEKAAPLWIVFIGHGTFDGRSAKFNLVGPDVTAEELAEWLKPVGRPCAIINCASASGPFLNALSQSGRVVITATKSGHEVNFARFGGRLARAIDDLSADLDKDGQVSLFEAFLTASRQTQSDYEAQQQLATEHALLDDNGDGRGISADFFDGLRPAKAAEDGAELDGHRAHQWYFVPSEEERLFPDELRPRRDELELEIAALRDQKPRLEESVYYADLERLLIELAELYERADQIRSASDKNSDATPTAPEERSQ